MGSSAIYSVSDVRKKKEDSFPDLVGDLHRAGFLSFGQAKVLLKEQRQSGRLPEDLLVSLGFMAPRVLEDFLCHHQGVTFFNPEEHFFDPSCLACFPKEVAKAHHILPLHLEEDKLYVAVRDIHDVLAIDAVKRYYPQAQKIELYSARPDDLSLLLEEGYGAQEPLENILDEESAPRLHIVGTEQDHRKTAPTRFLQSLLRRSVKDQASDIHLEPEKYCVHVRCRVDGVLRHTYSFHKDSWSEVCVAIKMMAGMDIAESRKSQNGRFTEKLYGRDVDFRVATHPTLHGENVVLRVLDKLYSLKELNELGFQAFQADLLKRQLLSPEGLILLTGPTGSGKTTTLYSMLRYLRSSERNIMTLEEPIEYEVKGIRQSSIKDLGCVGFADGVRSLLRQDPDVILIGEIRDQETATMALRAAMTGHLVLSTLHSNDAIGAFQRLQDLGLSPGLMEGNFLSVVAQRLVRLQCSSCFLTRESGCDECEQTGYKGRTAIAEVLEVTRDLDRLIGSDKGRHALSKQSEKDGFVSLHEHGLNLVKQKETSLAEIRRVLGEVK